MALIRGTSKTDTLHGTGADDSIYGYQGNDKIFAGGGSDTVIGGPGEDTIFGEDGDDHISGGEGRDELFGGAGSDIFNYFGQGNSSASHGIDTIRDFEMGVDRIDLSNIDAVATTRGAKINEAFTYVEGTDGRTPGHLTLSYDPATGITTLSGYTDTVSGADLTIYVVGQLDPLTDIIF